MIRCFLIINMHFFYMMREENSYLFTNCSTKQYEIKLADYSTCKIHLKIFVWQ